MREVEVIGWTKENKYYFDRKLCEGLIAVYIQTPKEMRWGWVKEEMIK